MAFNNYDHIFTTSTLCIIVIFLYLMSCCHSCDSGTCLEKSHSMVCTTGNEECSTPFVCRSDKNNINRCLCAVNNYYTSSTTSCTSDPAKPGKVYNVIQLPNTTTNGPYEYMIYFEASEGNVANYTFGVKNLTGLMTSSTPSVVSYELTPLKTYSYEIIAQNIVGYVSEKTIGSFSTPAEVKFHGVQCIGNEECSAPLECRNDTNNIKRCLCAESNYFTSPNSCYSVTQLQVKNPSVQSRTTSSVYITWSVNSGSSTNVNYKIQAGSLAPVTATSTGGNATGLSPGQQYNLWIISTLPADSYYRERNTNVTLTYWTVKVHSQECSTDFDCEELFSCIDYKNSGKKCLCRDGLYYTQTSGCTPITQLQVQTPSVQSRTTSSIYITWSINAGIPANVNYKIQVGSLAPITASSTGGDVTGLSPGQQYTLWIVSTLPANSYYPDLNTNVSVAFWTSGEEVNYTALAIGLGIGLPCIIIIIIVAAICINRHLRNKKLEAMRRQEPRYNTPSRTFQDDHLYGVSNENMTPVISEPDQVSQPARNGDVYDEIPDYIN